MSKQRQQQTAPTIAEKLNIETVCKSSENYDKRKSARVSERKTPHKIVMVNINAVKTDLFATNYVVCGTLRDTSTNRIRIFARRRKRCEKGEGGGEGESYMKTCVRSAIVNFRALRLTCKR